MFEYNKVLSYYDILIFYIIQLRLYQVYFQLTYYYLNNTSTICNIKSKIH